MDTESATRRRLGTVTNIESRNTINIGLTITACSNLIGCTLRCRCDVDIMTRRDCQFLIRTDRPTDVIDILGRG